MGLGEIEVSRRDHKTQQETMSAPFVRLSLFYGQPTYSYCFCYFRINRGCVISVNVPQYLSYDFVKLNIRNSGILRLIGVLPLAEVLVAAMAA